jgi:hypothetical protein
MMERRPRERPAGDGSVGAPDPLEERLGRWRRARLITRSQADAIRAYERARGLESGRRAAAPAHMPVDARFQPRRPEPVPAGARAERDIRLPAQWPRLDARALGTVIAALAVLALLGGVFAVTVDLLVAPLHNMRSELEDVAHLVASAVGLIGGLRMAAGNPGGRRLVYLSLGVNVAVTILLGFDRLLQPFTLLPLGVWIVLAALTYGARFRARATIAT